MFTNQEYKIGKREWKKIQQEDKRREREVKEKKGKEIKLAATLTTPVKLNK